MNKNDKIELNIIDMTKDGLGLAKASGQVFFVKDGLVGDIVEAVITKIDKNIVYAKVISVIDKSKYRVESSCPISNACGGCQLLNLDYNKQLEIKMNYVLSCLIKIAKLDNIHMSEYVISNYNVGVNTNSHELLSNKNDFITYDGIVSAENKYNFRNKMQVPFSYRDGKVIYGFYASRTHSIIECDECEVGFDGSNTILKSITFALEKYGISIYDEKTHQGLFREVMLRVGNESNEVSITYIINDKNYNKNLNLYRDFDNYVLEEFNKFSIQDSDDKLMLVTSTININTTANNVIFGNKNITIRGNGYIEDSIGSVKYHISPESFYQVNIEMTKKLYDTILEYGEFKGQECVLDLYCGIGTISLYIARYVKMVLGIEIVEKAIENAIENARLNNIENAVFICKDVSKIKINDEIDAINSKNTSIEGNKDSYKILMNKNVNYDTIIVDPPRKGLDQNAINLIDSIKPKKIIYVSCDPATLSRDIDIICNKGNDYRVAKIKNVDMFPHTMHIETLCLIERMK